MATQNVQQTIQQPKQASEPAKTGAAIFVMPEEYRFGVKGTVKTPEVPKPPKPPAPQPAKKTPPPPPPPPPKPTPAPVPLPPKPKGKKKMNIFVLFGIIGVVLIAVLALVYFLVLASAKETTPAPAEEITRPAPEVVIPDEPVEEDPVEDPAEDPDLFEAGTSPGIDTDSDGLTDLEEILIYETNANLPDTDKDGFLDGNEVNHRYHPNGLAPLTLLDSGVVDVYQWSDLDQEQVYAIYYPAMWKYEASERDGLPVIIFKATTGERIEAVLYQYDFESIQVDGSGEEWFSKTSKNGYQMLVSTTQLKAYIAIGQEVYYFRYDPGIKGTIDYLQTFQMMLNSLEVEETAYAEDPV
jgi:hypothetical protein